MIAAHDQYDTSPCDNYDRTVYDLRLTRTLVSRVGVFSTLTNSYALVAVGASENFYRFVPDSKIEAPAKRQ